MVTTAAIRRANLQSNHHQQTNNKSFLQAICPSCRPTNSVRAPKGKYQSHTKLTWGSSNRVLIKWSESTGSLFRARRPWPVTFRTQNQPWTRGLKTITCTKFGDPGFGRFALTEWNVLPTNPQIDLRYSYTNLRTVNVDDYLYSFL